MNEIKLSNVIQKYIKHVTNVGDIQDINERNKRKVYYKS